MNRHPAVFHFDNTFARDMAGFYVPWQAETAPNPELIAFNATLADELGLNAYFMSDEEKARTFSGDRLPVGATPIAQAYAGHQFGGFSAQLGDGRALLLGEVIDDTGQRRDIQLKGSGRTPFSRGSDGKAALGPVLREYLMSEAMHALGIPTTRALAAVTTGETVMRDGPQKGAVLTRVAASHLRVGTFQFFAARGDHDKVRQLADYAIARHYPHLSQEKDKYLELLSAVINAQVALVAQWIGVGFVHGVMNTDNMTISGETIDYGPCAFMDSYDPKAVYSSIDRSGRYAFGNQPVIAQWNLARFAETLLPLIDPKDSEKGFELAASQVNSVPERYLSAWLREMRMKIGLTSEEPEDSDLLNSLFDAMEGQNVDYTQFFRALARAAEGDTERVIASFATPNKIGSWLENWRKRALRDPISPKKRRDMMDKANPLYIPRNHKVEAALTAADNGDLAPFGRFVDALSDPFTQREGLEDFEGPAPDGFGPYVTYCGT